MRISPNDQEEIASIIHELEKWSINFPALNDDIIPFFKGVDQFLQEGGKGVIAKKAEIKIIHAQFHRILHENDGKVVFVLPQTQCFYAFLVDVQLRLTEFFPLNNIIKNNDVPGQIFYQDTAIYSSETVSEKEFPNLINRQFSADEAIATTTGYLVHKKRLADYFRLGFAYEMDNFSHHARPRLPCIGNSFVQIKESIQLSNDSEHFRTWFDYSKLTDQEIAHFIKNGISILKPTKELIEVDRILHRDIRFDVITQDLEKARSRALRQNAFIMGYKSFMYGVGIPAFFALLIVPFFFFPPSLLAVGTLVGSSLFAGTLSHLFQQDGSFFESLFFAFAANWLLMSLIALAAPSLFAGLASYALISDTLRITLTEALPMIVAFTPVATFVTGMLAQLFAENALYKLHHAIDAVVFTTLSTTFGIVGGILYGTVEILSNMFRPKLRDASSYQLKDVQTVEKEIDENEIGPVRIRKRLLAGKQLDNAPANVDHEDNIEGADPAAFRPLFNAPVIANADNGEEFLPQVGNTL